jgi:enoyl-[acyl-carrier protein] reductase I
MRRAATFWFAEVAAMDTRSPLVTPIATAIATPVALPSLVGKRGLIVGIANEHSIAYGCARVIRSLGGALALTYMNAKAEPHVRPLAESLQAEIVAPLDVEQPGDMDVLFAQIDARWGRLDFLLHSIALAPASDLHGRVIDSSAAGFACAMDISCHSFLRLAHAAEPLMQHGGTMITMSYHGAQKVVANYGIMGPVKAALESCVRALSAELGPGGIRVHAVSPGPIRTRAASGIGEFEKLLDEVAARAPEHQLVTIDDVGAVTALLCSDAARALTGNVVFVDAGYHIMG